MLELYSQIHSTIPNYLDRKKKRKYLTKSQ
jgi:hypothetical protein